MDPSFRWSANEQDRLSLLEKKRRTLKRRYPSDWMKRCIYKVCSWGLSENQLIGWVFSFKWCISLRRLFNADAKAILVEEQLWYYLTHSWKNKGVLYLSQRYLSESERNSATGVWTRLHRGHSPAPKLLRLSRRKTLSSNKTWKEMGSTWVFGATTHFYFLFFLFLIQYNRNLKICLLHNSPISPLVLFGGN